MNLCVYIFIFCIQFLLTSGIAWVDINAHPADTRKNGTLERLLRDLRSLDLLILDEWGYVPVDKDSSQLLFRVISDSYESKSLILTTNLEFPKWGGIFTDD